MDKLTPKQERFCEEYLVDLNAKQAAIRAGYSEKAADSTGTRTLAYPYVAERIAEMQAARSQRVQVTQNMVIEELRRVAFANMKTFVKWGPDRVDLLSSEALPDDATAAVAEVRQTVTQHGGSMGIKLYDKLGALQLLGKHLGMFVDKSEGTNLNIDLDSLTTEQLQRFCDGESLASVLKSSGVKNGRR